MNLIELFSNNIARSGAVETTVRKYGADFISNYGVAALAGAGVLLGPVGPLITVPAAALLVCAANKIQHDSYELDLLRNYDDQIASGLPDGKNGMGHRDPASLTTADMKDYVKRVRCGSNVLECELQDNDWRMTSSILLHAVSGALFGLLAVAAASVGAATGLDLLGTLGLTAGAVVAFQQIDDMVTKAGRVLLDANRPSAHQGIMKLENDLHEGKRVRRLQVLGVILDGDKAFRTQVQEEFGSRFEDMYLDQKYAVLARHDKERNISGITQALNKGLIEAADLVALLCGMPPAMKHPHTALRLSEQARENGMEMDELENGNGTLHRDRLGKPVRHPRIALSESVVGKSVN